MIDAISLVQRLNDDLFRDYEVRPLAPSFEFAFGVDGAVIRYGVVTVWSERRDGPLDCDEVVGLFRERVRRILSFQRGLPVLGFENEGS